MRWTYSGSFKLRVNGEELIAHRVEIPFPGHGELPIVYSGGRVIAAYTLELGEDEAA